ncbi:PTS-dependent dihydroxyacetone kinase operon regulator (sigma-54 dependent transcriptional regulator) [Escherichia coli]|uniref:PTS-dependent dihydroxyacetone kinase operon regulator (Sigma-54 dependent transcriptional regulator) n=1 Tax=Escherichia coli TaxID=562 RepID=A0A2X3JVT1_ECOLX|nr:PTS-dependent dihydroxyacetone kinase operon regulator (sigma-54 dependent transcriptional regulator) [Escherichia coli]
MSGAFNNDGRGISPLIATSWERCNKLMKRETWNVPHQAQGVTFASIYRRKKAMLTLGPGCAGRCLGIYGTARVCAAYPR